MLFGNVVAVGRGITPLDLDGVWIDEEINLKGFRSLTSCVWYAQTAGLWKLVFEENFAAFSRKLPAYL